MGIALVLQSIYGVVWRWGGATLAGVRPYQEDDLDLANTAARRGGRGRRDGEMAGGSTGLFPDAPGGEAEHAAGAQSAFRRILERTVLRRPSAAPRTKQTRRECYCLPRGAVSPALPVQLVSYRLVLLPLALVALARLDEVPSPLNR